MNNNKKYTTIADLLTDDGFLIWHLTTNKTHEETWNKWIAEKPAHAALAKQAEAILAVLKKTATAKMPEQAVHASFERLVKKMISNGKKIYTLI